MSLNTQEALMDHWALDSAAAEVLADQIDSGGQANRIVDIYESLDSVAIASRNRSRELRGASYSDTSSMMFIDLGACSLGNVRGEPVDYIPLFDVIEEFTETFPNTLFGVRGNAAKPRSGDDWPGIHYSLDPIVRKQAFDFYEAAFIRNIPIITEVTQESQLGMYAPYLSGFWLGKRDMESTVLRGIASAYHLPVEVKNGGNGDPRAVAAAIQTIRGNSESRGNTGVKLSGIAGTHLYEGMTSRILPVAAGNQQVGIIARGHDVPKHYLAEERRRDAFLHLNAMLKLGIELVCSVRLDGSHDVPKMFDLAVTKDGEKNPDRLVPVLNEVAHGIDEKVITNISQLRGYIGEAGPVLGDTDLNYGLTRPHIDDLKVATQKVLQLAG